MYKVMTASFVLMVAFAVLSVRLDDACFNSLSVNKAKKWKHWADVTEIVARMMLMLFGISAGFFLIEILAVMLFNG